MTDAIEITNEMVEIAAKSDAEVDGRTYEALGAADKRRYQNRARKGLALVAPLIASQAAAMERERCAKVAEQEGKDHDGLSLMDFASRQTCDEIAAAIRAEVAEGRE